VFSCACEKEAKKEDFQKHFFGGDFWEKKRRVDKVFDVLIFRPHTNDREWRISKTSSLLTTQWTLKTIEDA